MPPAPDSCTSSWLRSATTRAASRSDSAPATYAAAISPCEWPITASGATPTERHSSASDTITANSTGCTTSTRSSPGHPARRAARRSATSRRIPRAPRRTRSICCGEYRCGVEQFDAHAQPLRALAGEDEHGLARGLAAVPRMTRAAQLVGGQLRPARPAADPDRRRRRRPDARRSTGPPATTPRRRHRAPDRRRTCAGQPGGLSPPTPRPTCADTTHGTDRHAGRSDRSSSVPIGGAASTITCALVPLIPNDDTPARTRP